MARIGLGSPWKCTFANEWCSKKTAAYRAYFGPSPELKEADVRAVTTKDLPGSADLAWASFPCQDLSLAGTGAGLRGERSGTFGPFWRLMQTLLQERRAPRIVVLENVIGAITSHHGEDFATIARLLAQSDYRLGAIIVDASRFLPQSRPRLFIIAVRNSIEIPSRLISQWPSSDWHSSSLIRGYSELPAAVKKQWIWWLLPRPTDDIQPLADVIEDEPRGVRWNSDAQTDELLALMSSTNRAKVKQASSGRSQMVGTLYKRTRPHEDGSKIQRAEVRFDGIAGCLRTPVGGSSRQTVFIVRGSTIKSRLLSPREAARLMGVPEDYPTPQNYNEAYHLFGDGLAVPVVRWLERHLLRPIASAAPAHSRKKVA